jgi:hypothetical protein
VVDPAALSGLNAEDPDVCFEAKYDGLVPPNKVRIRGLPVSPTADGKPWASIVLDERLKRVVGDIKPGDNVWLCGTLRRAARGVDFLAAAVHKMPPDLRRFEQIIERLRKEGNGDKLVDLGHKIKLQLKEDIHNINDMDKLEALSLKSYELGLDLKEKALKPDDIDGRYTLAMQWRDYTRKQARFRDLIQRVLELDPNHPRAVRIAMEEWGWDKFRGRMMPKSQIEEIQRREEEERKHVAAAEKAAREAKERDLQQAAQDRPFRLVSFQAQLRTSDMPARAAALRAAGEAIQSSPDLAFVDAALDVLVNLPDPAVADALAAAAQSGQADVRQRVYQALIWRGSHKEQTFLDVLGIALAAEKESAAARNAVAALAVVGGKPAAAVLMSALANPSSAVQDEVMEGLKTVTKQALSGKKEWEDWWAKNRDSFNPN